MMCGIGCSAPTTPTLITQTPIDIVIQWSEPYDNGGTEITSYTVEFTDLIAVNTLTFTVIDSLSFDFNLQNGLVSGTQYQV